jgi:hypothetical protein
VPLSVNLHRIQMDWESSNIEATEFVPCQPLNDCEEATLKMKVIELQSEHYLLQQDLDRFFWLYMDKSFDPIAPRDWSFCENIDWRRKVDVPFVVKDVVLKSSKRKLDDTHGPEPDVLKEDKVQSYVGLDAGNSNGGDACQKCAIPRRVSNCNAGSECLCDECWCSSCSKCLSQCQCPSPSCAAFKCFDCDHESLCHDDDAINADGWGPHCPNCEGGQMDIKINWIGDADAVCLACHGYLTYETKTVCDASGCSFFHESCMISVPAPNFDDGAKLCKNCYDSGIPPMQALESSDGDVEENDQMGDDSNSLDEMQDSKEFDSAGFDIDAHEGQTFDTWDAALLAKWLDSTSRTAIILNRRSSDVACRYIDEQWVSARRRINHDFHEAMTSHLEGLKAQMRRS